MYCVDRPSGKMDLVPPFAVQSAFAFLALVAPVALVPLLTFRQYRTFARSPKDHAPPLPLALRSRRFVLENLLPLLQVLAVALLAFLALADAVALLVLGAGSTALLAFAYCAFLVAYGVATVRGWIAAP